MIKVYCEKCWEKLQKELKALREAKALKETKVSAFCDDCRKELKEGDYVFCRECFEKKTSGFFIR